MHIYIAILLCIGICERLFTIKEVLDRVTLFGKVYHQESRFERLVGKADCKFGEGN